MKTAARSIKKENENRGHQEIYDHGIGKFLWFLKQKRIVLVVEIYCENCFSRRNVPGTGSSKSSWNL
jgi:hypothetical protein